MKVINLREARQHRLDKRAVEEYDSAVQMLGQALDYNLPNTVIDDLANRCRQLRPRFGMALPSETRKWL